jgi:hypothetical protein
MDVSGCGLAAAGPGEVRRRWEKSRDADEFYLDEPIWNRYLARAVTESGSRSSRPPIRCGTRASWLIDARETRVHSRVGY